MLCVRSNGDKAVPHPADGDGVHTEAYVSNKQCHDV